MGLKQVTSALALAGCGMGLIVGPVMPQEREGGVSATFDISSGLSVDTNEDLDPTSDGTVYSWDTNLGLSLSSQTRTDNFQASLGAVLSTEGGPGGDDDGFTIPTSRAGLSYSRELSRSRLSFSAGFRETEIDGVSTVFDPALGGTLLVSDSGSRRDTNLRGEIAVGTAGPVGLTFSISARDIAYDGTTRTDLFDQRSVTAMATADFKISPVVNATASLSVNRFEDEDTVPTERDTQSFFFGLNYLASKRTQVTLRLGARDIESTTAGDSSGSEWSLGIEHALPRGSLSASYASELTTAGRRDRLSVSRIVDLPGADLAFGIGLTEFDNGISEPTYSVSYEKDLPRGSVSASLSSDVFVDSDSNAPRTTRFNGNYTHLLDSRSRLNLGFRFTDIDDVSGSGVEERTRATLNASLERALAQDWAVTVGASYRYLDDDGVDAQGSSVFFRMSRSITLRP